MKSCFLVILYSWVTGIATPSLDSFVDFMDTLICYCFRRVWTVLIFGVKY